MDGRYSLNVLDTIRCTLTVIYFGRLVEKFLNLMSRCGINRLPTQPSLKERLNNNCL